MGSNPIAVIYMQSNNKFNKVITKHLKTPLEGIMTYMKVAFKYIYQTFPFFSAKIEICSSYLFQTILIIFGQSLQTDSNCDNSISLSSRENNNFSARNAPVACPIQYVSNLCTFKTESVSDQNFILMSSYSSTC